MSQIKLYLDEDAGWKYSQRTPSAMHSRLVTALRSRGIPVITVLDVGLIEKSDKEQVAFATEHGCVLYTFNVSDFHRLLRN